MTRVFSDYAYGTGPRDGCWWDETIPAPDWPVLRGELRADVGIIGGGFTGMSAALHLAEQGVSVALMEAQTPGFGASGRNGGFCCLGGGRMGDAELTRTYGAEGRRAFRDAEYAAVDLAAGLIARFGIDADTHSDGETLLANRASDMADLRAQADKMHETYGVEARVTERADLASAGFGGAFHGAMTIPVGFALNPRKYLFGLASVATGLGAQLFQNSQVNRITPANGGYRLDTAQGVVICDQVIIATNGYSSEDIPDWLCGRYMPTQSNVMVTRPLTQGELEAQGWTSDQMSYDNRILLHYFRLMPDRRFLFGLRGGLFASPRSEAAARARNRRDFDRMFPEWAKVEAPFAWSGMVCLSRNRVPYIGPVPGRPGMFAGLAYHGNGVAMASWSGAQLARQVLVPGAIETLPAPMRRPMAKFPLGRMRRALMPPIYLAMSIKDHF